MSCYICLFKMFVINVVLKNVLNLNFIFDFLVMLNFFIVCFKWLLGILKKLFFGIVFIWIVGLLKERVEVFCKCKVFGVLFSLYSDCDILI